ncbi:MAG: DUF192 domain-containing protein [Thermoplasmata archaeon]
MGPRDKLAIAVIAAALLATALSLLVPGATHPSASTVTIVSASGSVQVAVEIADEPAERARGLMFRESLQAGSGMLFVFGDERIRSFWMKNTLIPLDVLFIDGDLTIVQLVEGAVPCEADPCPRYTSTVPVGYALEVNAGFVRDHGIGIGDAVVLGE